MTDGDTSRTSPCGLDLEKVKSLVANGTELSEGNICTAIVEISGNRLVKYGRSVTKSEAIAMEFVREHTTIRVPRVFSYTRQPGQIFYFRKGYLVMEKLPGETLLKALPTLTPAQKAVVIQDLRGIVSQLRRLDDPRRWGMVGKDGAFHRGHFDCTRFDDRSAICRPQYPHAMADIRDFLLASLSPQERALYETSGRMADMIHLAFTEQDSRFSHSDLRPENIMVDETTRHVTGIIDWACAGWYPPFWDYYVAQRALDGYASGSKQFANWRDIYGQVFPPYEREVIGFRKLLSAARAEGENYYGQELCDCCE